MNTQTTQQSSAPAEPVRHPPEVIEAAKTWLSRPVSDTEAKHIAKLLIPSLFYDGTRSAGGIVTFHAGEVLRNALACAEQDLKNCREILAKNLASQEKEDARCAADLEHAEKALETERQRREKAEAQVERLLTPTPKTDSLREAMRGKSDRDFAIKLIAHANQQERELAEARFSIRKERKAAEAAESALRDITDGRTVYLQHEIDIAHQACIRLRDTRNRLLERVASLEAQLAEARKTLENLRGALPMKEFVEDHDPVATATFKRIYGILDAAREAGKGAQ